MRPITQQPIPCRQDRPRTAGRPARVQACRTDRCPGAGLLPGLALILLMLSGLPALGADDIPSCFTLKAGQVLDGRGNCYENGWVAIRDSRIQSVGGSTDTLPEGPVHDLGDVFLCPGLIDGFAHLGFVGPGAETATSVQAASHVMDSFHPAHHDFDCALKEGITSVVLAPTPDNVICGQAAVVKTAGACRSSRVVRAQGPPVFSIAPSSFREGRIPTSRMGALDLLAGAVADAEPGSLLHAFARNETPALFVADESYDLQAAVDWAAAIDAGLILVGASEADRILGPQMNRTHSFVLGPYDFTTPERTLRIAAAAAAAGCGLAFRSGAPANHPQSLRLTASLAVQNGLDKDQAFGAMTARAAELAGVAMRVGSLAPQKDADLVVFSAHPLDLKARVLRVYINGDMVYRSPAFDGTPTGKDREVR